MNRRRFLKNGGLSLLLPLLPSLCRSTWAFADSAAKKFIGVYFPDGTYMPKVNGQWTNGYWNYTDALSPLAKYQSDIAIVRGMTAGHSNLDIHWSGCGGWLSCGAFPLDPSNIVIAKTIDQYIADQNATPIRSLHAGWAFRNYSEHPASHSPVYLNYISWRTDRIANTNILSPLEMYNRVFSDSQNNQALIAHKIKMKKSVLDAQISDLNSLNNKISAKDKTLLDSYLTAIREIEKGLTSAIPTCSSSGVSKPASAEAYKQHFASMQKIIVTALRCNLTNAATIIYEPGVQDNNLIYDGMAFGHHGYAHHSNDPAKMAALLSINRTHTGLLADLIGEVKSAGLFGNTAIAYGTDMSDGDVHGHQNIPFLVAGGLSNMNFGKEIGNPNTQVFHGDILMELLAAYGIKMSEFGVGSHKGTGKKIGLFKG